MLVSLGMCCLAADMRYESDSRLTNVQGEGFPTDVVKACQMHLGNTQAGVVLFNSGVDNFDNSGAIG